MGKAKRPIPSRLPVKLKAIRLEIGISMDALIVMLESELVNIGYPDTRLHSGYITEFEKGKREPSLPVLLAYALIARTEVGLLIDDRKEVF